MADNPQAMAELRRLLAAREPLYAQARHTVDTGPGEALDGRHGRNPPHRAPRRPVTFSPRRHTRVEVSPRRDHARSAPCRSWLRGSPASRACRAQQPYLVRDINQTEDLSVGYDPAEMVALPAVVVFANADGLWRVDGGGPVLVASLEARGLTRSGDVVFFAGDDGLHQGLFLSPTARPKELRPSLPDVGGLADLLRCPQVADRYGAVDRGRSRRPRRSATPASTRATPVRPYAVVPRSSLSAPRRGAP